MQIYVFLALIIAVIAVIFALQNTLTVTISILFWQFHGSLALVLLLALVVGAAISFLASMPTLVRGQWSMRKLRKQALELESNLNDHKQRLEEAQLKLHAQSTPVQPSETSVKPPDQTAPLV
jgi:putative membrane protein